MRKTRLTLFVSKVTDENAIQDIRHIIKGCEPHAELTVIHVEYNPEIARIHNVVAVPTLVRETPEGVTTLIGKDFRESRLQAFLTPTPIKTPLVTKLKHQHEAVPA